MTLIDVFFYKIEHFLNPRCRNKDISPYVYKEDEADLLLLGVKKDNGHFQPFSRWYELFPRGQVDQIIHKLGFSDDDGYAIKIMLSRFGYLFQIDNRQRINKDIHIFFYVLQLVQLKQEHIRDRAKTINYFFRYLCFELCITDEVYNKFSISDNRLILRSDTLGDIDFYQLIKEIYAQTDNATDNDAICQSRNFQLSVVDLLCSDPKAIKDLPINDINKIWVSPEQFLLQYKKSKKRIFDVLASCFNQHQSNENLLISNIILMNYAYYILQYNKKSIFSLQKYVNNDAIFSNIISALAIRRVVVDKQYFTNAGLGQYLSLSEIENATLYNLIYST